MAKIDGVGPLAALHRGLQYRHAKDVLVEECNMGSAHAGCRRLDAWALVKTWSPWTTIGYELKVDRQDFLRDRKHAEYLAVCHEFYFVCPAKLIQPEELPEGVGLLWGIAGGTRLQSKRKAARHEPDPDKLLRLMSYVLMSRTRIVADMWEAARQPESGRDYWRRWLEEDEEDKSLGLRVSQAVQKVLREARARTQRAESRAAALESIQQKLDALGLGDVTSSYQLERRLSGPKPSVEVRRLAQQILSLVPEQEAARA